MGFFDWFKKKKATVPHDLNDDDRDLSLQVRRNNALIRQKRQELEFERMRLEHQLEIEKLQRELDELRAEGEDDEEDDAPDGTDAIMAALVGSILQGKNPVVSPNQGPQQPETIVPKTRKYSDEEIRVLLEAVPKHYRAIMKKLPDDALLARARQYAPDADEESLNRAISMVRYP